MLFKTTAEILEVQLESFRNIKVAYWIKLEDLGSLITERTFLCSDQTVEPTLSQVESSVISLVCVYLDVYTCVFKG